MPLGWRLPALLLLVLAGAGCTATRSAAPAAHPAASVSSPGVPSGMARTPVPASPSSTRPLTSAPAVRPSV
ncbi:MAG: serine/threonine-protein kinase, partial [Jatrophihabitans sp.]